MADADDTNEDSWLYGTSNPDSTTNEEERGVDAGVNQEEGAELRLQSAKSEAQENEAQAAMVHMPVADSVQTKPDDPEEGEAEESYGEFEDPAQEMEEDEEAAAAATAADTTDGDVENEGLEQIQTKQQFGSDDDVDDEDDSDDDINVVIGDIKAAPSTYNIKQRSNLLAGAAGAGQEKSKTGGQGGKFSVEDFEGVGTINGVPAHEFSIDSLEDKPWRKPGADITDYFNYGFNEETWRSYCERQKRMRVVESGVGLASLTQNLNQSGERHHDGNQGSGGGMSGMMPPGTHMPPPGSGMTSEQMQMPPPGMLPPPPGHHSGPPRMGHGMMPRGPRPIGAAGGSKENAIQVMTAECREYSRPGGQIPTFGGPPPAEEHFFPEPDPYDYGYEPTQESQWGNDNPGWVPTGIKELTPGPGIAPPPQLSGPPGVPQPQLNVPPPQLGGPPPQMRSHPPLMPGPVMPPNINMGPPPGMGMMMGPVGGPPMRMPMGPPHIMGPPTHGSMDRRDHDRDRERDSRRDRERREERDRERERERREERDRERERREERDRERERKDRDRDRERDRGEKTEKVEQQEVERPDEDRERRRRDRERERERDRGERGERERSRRERSRSREKTRRRSKSREKERSERSSKASSTSSSRSEKKKSHRKDKEEEEQ